MRRRRGRVVRPVALLLGLCLAAGMVVAGMAFPAALALGLVSSEVSDSVNSVSTDLATGQLPQTSTITDSAGNPIAYLFDQNRDPVPSDRIAPAMKAAIVAIEDRRFYQHQGVDWQGTIRAVVADSVSGDVVQGASTLTQQYVKNYLLYVEAQTAAERLKATEQTPARKLREARIALQLERSLSKEDILDRYLNIVFWGNGAFGVSAAARTYFTTTADQLTVAQAALLAGMVRSTAQFDPVTHPEAALQRRNVVIQQMAEQGMVDQTQAGQALAEPLGIANPLGTRKNGCIGAGDAGFFCKYVTDYLAQAGISLEQILRGGYTIRVLLLVAGHLHHTGVQVTASPPTTGWRRQDPADSARPACWSWPTSAPPLPAAARRRRGASARARRLSGSAVGPSGRSRRSCGGIGRTRVPGCRRGGSRRLPRGRVQPTRRESFCSPSGDSRGPSAAPAPGSAPRWAVGRAVDAGRSSAGTRGWSASAAAFEARPAAAGAAGRAAVCSGR